MLCIYFINTFPPPSSLDNKKAQWKTILHNNLTADNEVKLYLKFVF